MATKRTSYLKRQKEQKRLERAIQKREGRILRRHEKSDESVSRTDTDFNEDVTE